MSEIIPRVVQGETMEHDGKTYVADAVVDVHEDGYLVMMSGHRLPLNETAIEYAKENLDKLIGPCWRST